MCISIIVYPSFEKEDAHPSQIQSPQLRLVSRSLRAFAGDHAQHGRIPARLLASLRSVVSDRQPLLRCAGMCTRSICLLNQ